MTYSVCVGRASFYAESVDRAALERDFDFYFVKSAVAGVEECARFCFDRHFCNSAVHDSRLRTCSVSYIGPARCSLLSHSDFVEQFAAGASDLTAIRCVKCQKLGVSSL